MRDFGRCEERVRQEEIVRREKRSRFVIRNPRQAWVRVIRIDNCVITEGPRCDFLFLAEGKGAEIYVELKGAAVARAIVQIEASIPQVSSDAGSAPKWCYIVCGHVSHPELTTRIQLAKKRFRREYSAELTVKGKVAEHDLAGHPGPSGSR